MTKTRCLVQQPPGVADPDLVGRGNRAHKRTRNALGAYLISLGIQPLDPVPSDPPFDLAWWKGGILYVAEVKSLTRENEERQLRLGLGQLLRYSHLLRKRAEHVIPVLVPELKPRDSEWGQLCKALNVKLVFPPNFEALIDETTEPSADCQPSRSVDTRMGIRTRSDQSMTQGALLARCSRQSGELEGLVSAWLPAAHEIRRRDALLLLTSIGPSTGEGTAHCPAQTPPPNPTAAGPGDGRVRSSPSSRVHEPCTSTEAVALRSQTGLTGSGSHRSSYGGFGGGHPHFHPHRRPPATQSHQLSAVPTHYRRGDVTSPSRTSMI